MSDLQEIASEQEYFDAAADAREAMRERFRKAPVIGGANSKTDEHLRKKSDKAIEALGGPEEPVAFGRTDGEQGTFYIGKHLIHDATHEPLVISWKATVAAPYYKASVADQMGITRRRTFSTKGNEILNLDDLIFAAIVGALPTVELVAKDRLLEELGRIRTGEMAEIAQTIQASQYELVSSDLDQLLVVQGGPGTGKTIVALHRVSWLLYNHREDLRPDEVLVVGPNTTFLRYVRNVLPELGDRNIPQSDIGGLFGPLARGREEAPATARLKGEPRIRDLIDRGLQDRIRVPQDDLAIQGAARPIKVDPLLLSEAVDRFKARPYAAGREALRDHLREIADQQGGASATALDGFLNRVWPQLSEQAFLQELWGSTDRLLKAAGTDFTAADVLNLYRKAAERVSEERWSAADVAVLDYVRFAMSGTQEERYQHIVVDEAQDLSPMELEMLKRRSATGSMTILGDLAQSTGLWARDSWDEIVETLERDLPVRREELRLGYRVPRRIFEFAAKLLPHIAPKIQPPTVVRDLGEDPKLVQTDDEGLADQVVSEITAYAQNGLLVGVICPETRWAGLTAALDAHGKVWADSREHGIGSPISLVRPLDARGLEFDAVVVVDPEGIVAEVENGHRLLFVCLTRTTRHLTVVHTGVALPLPSA